MSLTSLKSSLLIEKNLTNQTFPKSGNKTVLAQHLIDPLLALLKSDQIQATRGEMNALRGLETRLRSLRHESYSEFLGRDLMNLAQEYLYSVTFQPLALSILTALKDSSLPQTAAAASLLASFKGTAGSLGQHLTHQLRRVTQTEILVPIAAAIATGSLAGSFFRAGITGMLRGSAVARLGGGAALHALSAAGSLAGNAATFPLGLGAGNLLVGKASGLDSLLSYRESFLHGLTLMGTLGVAGWAGCSLRWGIHGTKFIKGAEQATRLRPLTRLTTTTIPFSAELGGLMFMNSIQDSGKLTSYYLAGALGMILECRLGAGIAHGLAPSLYRVGTLLNQKTFEWARESVTRSWLGLRSQLGRVLPPSSNNSTRPSDFTPAFAAAATGSIFSKELPNKIETSNPLQGPVHSYVKGNASGVVKGEPRAVSTKEEFTTAIREGEHHLIWDQGNISSISSQTNPRGIIFRKDERGNRVFHLGGLGIPLGDTHGYNLILYIPNGKEPCFYSHARYGGYLSDRPPHVILEGKLHETVWIVSSASSPTLLRPGSNLHLYQHGNPFTPTASGSLEITLQSPNSHRTRSGPDRTYQIKIPIDLTAMDLTL